MSKPQVLAEPVLVGREKELEELQQFLKSAIEGKGKTVFISGEAGAGKREFLNDYDSKGLMFNLNNYFETMVEIPRMHAGKRQTFETLITEEAFLLAKYLRNERKDWNPRIPSLSHRSSSRR